MHVSVPLQVASPQPIAPVEVLDADDVLPDALELAGLPLLLALPLPLDDALEPLFEPPLPPSPPSGSIPLPCAHATRPRREHPSQSVP